MTSRPQHHLIFDTNSCNNYIFFCVESFRFVKLFSEPESDSFLLYFPPVITESSKMAQSCYRFENKTGIFRKHKEQISRKKDYNV